MSRIFYGVLSGGIPYLMFFCSMWEKELIVKQRPNTSYILWSYVISHFQIVVTYEIYILSICI